MLVDKIFSEISQISHELISKQQLNTIKKYEKAAGVAVWGTGRAGKYAINFCKKYGVELICAVDSFEHEECSTFEGLPLYSEKDFFMRFPNVLVLISCSYSYYIDQKLAKHGVPYLMFDTNLFDQCGDSIQYQDILQGSKEEIEAVYTLLSDDISKHVFERILKYRLSLDQSYIQGLNTQNIYFDNDVIPRFIGDTFIDCGAYIGDTLLSFYRSKNCECKKYYALEPSLDTFKKLESVIQNEQLFNVIPLRIGAWDQTDTLRFADTPGAGSWVSNMGSVEIQVDSLDHLFYQENVDFIKMDIEGAETAAITGAKHIIEKYTPIMAFSIYHRANDLWKLPLLVKEINPGYRLFVRHHSPWGDDTVLYAIP